MSVTKGVVLGYGLGSFMRVGENLVAFYLIFYLTTVVGLSASTAGLISGASVVIGALASPIFGRLSDRSKLRSGRRRPFILIFAFPAMALLTLLFINVDLGRATGTYYFLVATVFAIVYYAFLVPYDALGASLTEDSNQRATIRSLCTGALYLSVLVGGTLVLQLQALLAGYMPAAEAWTWAVVLSCTVPGLVFGLIAWRVTRGRELTPEPTNPGAGSLRSIGRLVTLRPAAAIFTWTAIYFFANGLLGGSLIYLGVYALGLSEGTSSTLFLIGSLATFVTVWPAASVVRRVGKRYALLSSMGFFILISTIVLVVGPHGYVTGAILSAAFGVANSIALVCSYAMIYDLREVTELQLGEDMTAVAVSIFTLLIGVFAALSYVALGYILEAAGFDAAAAPSPHVVHTLMALQTWVPSSLMAISGIALLFWNVNEQDHKVVVDQLHSAALPVERGTFGPSADT